MTSSYGTPGDSLKPPVQPAQLYDRRRYIHLYAEAFSNGLMNVSLDVLAGDQPPTIVGGYAQWAQVALPLRVARLVYTGRDAVTIQIALRFMLFDKHGSWLTSETAGLALEEQMRWLEWMAGEGDSPVPPLVWLSTYDASGSTTALIPLDYQAGTPGTPAVFGDKHYAPQWVITAVAWDTAPIRTANGSRIRQDVTVTLSIYQQPPGAGARKVPRPKSTTFVSRAGADTALTIARAAPAEDPPRLATAIMHAAQNAGLQLRSVNQPIRHGKRVIVPSSIAASATS